MSNADKIRSIISRIFIYSNFDEKEIEKIKNRSKELGLNMTDYVKRCVLVELIIDENRKEGIRKSELMGG